VRNRDPRTSGQLRGLRLLRGIQQGSGELPAAVLLAIPPRPVSHRKKWLHARGPHLDAGIPLAFHDD
jgi:hypothetical protein